MEIPLFLAMTAAELRGAASMPSHPAWMACHFSCYGTGISNVPKRLPAGSMLMLNDRTPMCGHDPELVARMLCDAAEEFQCDSILLDFQRDGQEGLDRVIGAVLEQAPCPVGISSLYAAACQCPVLLPPVPPHKLPEDAVTAWKDRELWLEISMTGTAICVTTDGSKYADLPDYCPKPSAHTDSKLYCHYEITVQEDQILFRLGRTMEDQRALLDTLNTLGVTKALGFWQEMRA